LKNSLKENKNVEYLMQNNNFFYLSVQKVFFLILYGIKRSTRHIYGFEKMRIGAGLQITPKGQIKKRKKWLFLNFELALSRLKYIKPHSWVHI
jgi:hypothetical protein